MTTTHNPQAAADQARAAYRAGRAQLGQLGLDTVIPEDMRALAEKTVAQSREAYDRSKDAFEASLTTFERSFDAAGQGAAAFNRKMIDIARRNVDASFDLATSLAGAKSFADMLELADGLLAQAARRSNGASRGSSHAVDESDGRCGRADQGTNGATEWLSSSRILDFIR